MHRYTCISDVISTKVNLLEIALVECQYCHYNLMLPHIDRQLSENHYEEASLETVREVVYKDKIIPENVGKAWKLRSVTKCRVNYSLIPCVEVASTRILL